MRAVLDWFLDSSHVLSLVAIFISVLAWITSWKTQRRLVMIEETRESDRIRRARKARIRAKLIREPTGTSMGDLLRVYNDGEVEARDVRASISGNRAPEILGDTTRPARIGPTSHIQYPLAIAMGMSPPWDLEVTWTDDSGEPGTYQTTLTM